MHKLKAPTPEPVKRPSRLASHERVVLKELDSDNPATRSAMLDLIKSSAQTLGFAVLNSTRPETREAAANEINDPDVLEAVLSRTEDENVIEIVKSRLQSLLWHCESETLVSLASCSYMDLRIAALDEMVRRKDPVGLGYISVVSEYEDIRKLAQQKMFQLSRTKHQG